MKKPILASAMIAAFVCLLGVALVALWQPALAQNYYQQNRGAGMNQGGPDVSVSPTPPVPYVNPSNQQGGNIYFQPNGLSRQTQSPAQGYPNQPYGQTGYPPSTSR